MNELTLCKDCRFWKQDCKFGVMGDDWGICSLLMKKEKNLMVVIYARDDKVVYTRDAFGCPAGREKPREPFETRDVGEEGMRLWYGDACRDVPLGEKDALDLVEWLNKQWAEREGEK